MISLRPAIILARQSHQGHQVGSFLWKQAGTCHPNSLTIEAAETVLPSVPRLGAGRYSVLISSSLLSLLFSSQAFTENLLYNSVTAKGPRTAANLIRQSGAYPISLIVCTALTAAYQVGDTYWLPLCGYAAHLSQLLATCRPDLSLREE